MKKSKRKTQSKRKIPSETVPAEPAIRKIESIQDKAADQILEVIEFRMNNGGMRRFEWAPSVVHEPRLFEKALRDKGALLPSKDEVRSYLETVAAQKCPRELIYAERTGWMEDQNAFVFPDGAIGPNTKNVCGVNRADWENGEPGRLSYKGTAASWKANVAANAAFSSLLIFGGCVAFAAPLLKAAAESSFTVCLFAPTRKGKTKATVVASSVIGIGIPENLIAWTITNARLDERLAEYNDSVFPIDDFESLEDEASRYEKIRGVSYRLASGVGKARSRIFTKSRGAPNVRWRAIALTSSEKSVQQLAKIAGRARRQGDAVRLIDVPALIDGEDHIFDRIPSDLNGKSVPQWTTAKFTELQSACSTNHGAVYREYIKYLIAQGERLASLVNKLRKKFIEHVADTCDDDQTRDIARKFALLFAGGVLAHKAKLVDWDDEVILKSVTKFYRAARELLPNDAILLREGVELLRKTIATFTTAPFGDELPLDSCANWDGFKTHILDNYTCLITREAFDAAFASRMQRNLVERWLVENGMVTLAQKHSDSTPTPKGQHQWPDKKRRRSLEIKWHGDFEPRERS